MNGANRWAFSAPPGGHYGTLEFRLQQNVRGAQLVAPKADGFQYGTVPLWGSCKSVLCHVQLYHDPCTNPICNARKYFGDAKPTAT